MFSSFLTEPAETSRCAKGRTIPSLPPKLIGHRAVFRLPRVLTGKDSRQSPRPHFYLSELRSTAYSFILSSTVRRLDNNNDSIYSAKRYNTMAQATGSIGRTDDTNSSLSQLGSTTAVEDNNYVTAFMTKMAARKCRDYNL